MQDNHFQTAVTSFQEALTQLGPTGESRDPVMFHLLNGLIRLSQGLQQQEEKMEGLKASFATTQPPQG